MPLADQTVTDYINPSVQGGVHGWKNKLIHPPLVRDPITNRIDSSEVNLEWDREEFYTSNFCPRPVTTITQLLRMANGVGDDAAWAARQLEKGISPTGVIGVAA